MRLGILPLGQIPDSFGVAALADTLRAEDIDVVIGEEASQTVLAVAREAERLHRADCDGILVVVPSEAPLLRPAAFQAALHLPNIPLLLTGAFTPSFFEVVGALEETGSVWYDRLLLAESGLTDQSARITDWLKENERRERQRGYEAARKLYGKRFALFGDLPEGAAWEPARWLSRFGVTLCHFTAGELLRRTSGNADTTVLGEIIVDLYRDEEIVSGSFGILPAAPQEVESVVMPRLQEQDNPPFLHLLRGDMWEALAGYLILQAAGSEKTTGGIAAVGPDLARATGTSDEAVTFFALHQRAGRLHGLIGFQEVVVASPDKLAALLSSPTLAYAGGNHIGALRAACHVLDIDVTLLR